MLVHVEVEAMFWSCGSVFRDSRKVILVHVSYVYVVTSDQYRKQLCPVSGVMIHGRDVYHGEAR
jgi:hypothetical protein